MLTIKQIEAIKPTDSHVIVKDCPLPPSLSIEAPQNVSDPIMRGQVVQAGPKAYSVKRGDIVHYPLYRSCSQGFPEGYTVMAEDAILIIEEGEPVKVESTKRSGLDRSGDFDDTVKFLKEINVGKELEKKRKKVIVDLKGYTL